MKSLDKDMEIYTDFLTTLECTRVLRENKISMHLNTENIFLAQQVYIKIKL